MPFYAIGIKNYVELRKAQAAPKAEISSFKKKLKIYQQDWGRPPDYQKLVSKTMTFKNVIHIGGKVIGAIPIKKFKELTGMIVSDGEVHQLSKEKAEAIIAGMLRVQEGQGEPRG